MQSGALNHARLIKYFKTLGPYIREEQSSEDSYFFDCLAICVSARIDPTIREFWGWWMTLARNENVFSYRYQLGLYDTQGKWQSQEIPKKKADEINGTLNRFYEHLAACLKELDCTLVPADDLDKNKVISAA